MTFPTTQQILIVDDDKEIVRLLRAYMEQASFKVAIAYDGKTAMHVLHAERPALMLLDLMLPDRDGWDITRTVREDPALSTLPIIMLTARVEDSDKILGLELGADDYITKPFNPYEVVARVRSVLRRTGSGIREAARTFLQWAGLSLDLSRRTFALNGQPIELTRTEFELMRVLMEHPGYVFTRSELIEQSFGYEYESLERTLDSHIKNLRKKIEPDPRQPQYIQTVYGVGYQLGSTAP